MGKVGKFRVAVCVLIMTWQSGSATERLCTAGWMSRRTEISERDKMSSGSGVGVDRMGRGRREILLS